MTPLLRRIGRQQSVRWGEGRRTRTATRGWKVPSPHAPRGPRVDRRAINVQLARVIDGQSGPLPVSQVARVAGTSGQNLSNSQADGSDFPRASCVPDEPVNAGNSRSLADTSACLLACTGTGHSLAAYVLLSNRSSCGFKSPLIIAGGRFEPGPADGRRARKAYDRCLLRVVAGLLREQMTG